MSRREYAKALVAAGGAAALAACLEDQEDPAPTGTDDPESLPERQHAWDDVLATDDDGNVENARHHVLLYLDLLADRPSEDDRETGEAALRSLERAFEWSSEGLVFTIGYSPAYFDRFDEPLPESVDLPDPEPLSPFEDPDELTFDTQDAIVHLASDRPDVVLEAEEALLGEVDEANGVETDADLSEVFEVADRRTGFVGPGLPAENQDVDGVPDSEPVHEDAPLFMGFRSNFERNQASEDRVTIREGPFAGGSTQHVSKLRQQLDVWYTQDNHYQRTAKMFSPKHAEEDLVGEVGEKLEQSAEITDEVIDGIEEDARTFGMVGHSQKVARAREDGEPIILRRDFDTTDDDVPGLHFLSLQREIGDFVKSREAMNGQDVAANSPVGSRVNNGILQYVFVNNRGNFLLPPREHRALPGPRPE